MKILEIGIPPDIDVYKLETEKASERIALIDADSMLYYCMKADHSFEEMKLNLDTFLLNILVNTQARYFVPFTTNSRDVFRKKYGKTREYKGNRKGRETPHLFYALKAYATRQLGFYSVPGLEADDCVALYNSDGMGNPFKFSTICSPDKDVLQQVPGNHYNYQRNEFHRTTDEEAFNFLWLQTAAGDSVDGIPGIPGIGMKKAEKAIDGIAQIDVPLKILQMYIEKFNDGSTESVKESVDKFKETLDLVYVLRSQNDLDRVGLTLPDLKYYDILKVLGKWQEEQGQV